MSMGSELSAADIAAVTNGGGFGGENGAWWIIILLLALGGRGFGGFGGGDNMNAGFAWQGIDGGIRGVQQGICDSTYALNNTINNGFRGVDNAVCTLGYNMQQGFNTVNMSIADCCCQTQRMLERGFCELGQKVDANGRAVIDYLNCQKVEQLRDENQTLKLAASQAKQNAYLLSQLRPLPIPSYTVPNPFETTTGA